MHRYRQAVGWILGPQSVEFAEARRVGLRGVRVRSGRIALPDDPADARQALRDVMERNGWRGVPGLLSVASEALFLRRVECLGSQAELLDAVRTEMDAFSEMMPAQALQDSIVLGRRRGRWSALFVVARPDAVDRSLEHARASGLTIVDALPASLALFVAASRLCPRGRRPFAAIRVGETESDSVAGFPRDPFFARRIALGRAHLPRDAGGHAPDAEAAEAFDTWLEELAASLQTGQADGSRPPVEVLMLFGIRPPDACLRRIEDRLGCPVQRMDGPSGRIDLGEMGQSVAAAGLALAGIGAAPLHLSLMPPPLRERLALQRLRRAWVGAVLAAAAALALLIADANRQLRRCRAERDAGRVALEQTRETVQEIARLRAANEQLLETLSPLRDNVAAGRAVAALLSALAESKHGDDWITLVAEAGAYFEGGDRPPRREPDDPPPRGTVPFVIEGYTATEDLSTVRGMIESLRRLPRVLDADLLGDDRIRADPLGADQLLQMALHRFAVEVTLWPH